jgi:outer membrane lipoprotein-sorting protein
MKAACRLASVAALFLPLLLSGCFLLVTTRRLPVPKAPAITQTVTPEELVSRINQRWDALESLNASVEIQASVMKSKEGLAKDYTTIPGIILLRKPAMLRVYGRVPVIGTRAFDMVSDGTNFTLYIPSKNKAIKGSNSLEKKSLNQMENMR